MPTEGDGLDVIIGVPKWIAATALMQARAMSSSDGPFFDLLKLSALAGGNGTEGSLLKGIARSNNSGRAARTHDVTGWEADV